MSEIIKAGTEVKATEGGWDLIKGNIYKLTQDSHINRGKMVYTIRDEKEIYEYDSSWFEIVEESRPSMEEQVALAKSYIGKEVLSGPDRIRIQRVIVIINEADARNSSQVVLKDFDKHGYCIAIKGSCFTVPVLSVQLAPVEPPFKMVELNSTYTAKVTKDTIEVGCQTFPISILDELIAAHESII